jgi:NAD(P)H-flavin reductase
MARLPTAEVAAGGGVMLPAWYRVSDRRQETHDTWTLSLVPEAGSVADFAPGQFSMLYAFGKGEAPISVSGNLTTPGPLVHTIRAVGAVSRTLCGLEPGALVGVRGPFGTSWPIAQVEGRDIVIVAGGIGLAPLRPVIYHVLAHRERYGRLVIAYGGRSPADLIYAQQLEQWRGRFDVELDVTVDTAGASWRGRVGVVPKLIPRARLDGERCTAFVCGPEVMMRFTAAALRDAGMHDAAIHVSLERSMKCAVGLCGHCQLREIFVCKDGPVFSNDRVEPLMKVRAL